MKLDFKKYKVKDYIKHLADPNELYPLLGTDGSKYGIDFSLEDEKQIYKDGSTTYVSNAVYQVHYNMIQGTGFRYIPTRKMDGSFGETYYFDKLTIRPDYKSYNFFKYRSTEYSYKTKTIVNVYKLTDTVVRIEKSARNNELKIIANDYNIKYTEQYSKNSDCLRSHLSVTKKEGKLNRLYTMEVVYKIADRKIYLSIKPHISSDSKWCLPNIASGSIMELYGDIPMFEFNLRSGSEDHEYVYFMLSAFKSEIERISSERKIFKNMLNIIKSYENGD